MIRDEPTRQGIERGERQRGGERGGESALPDETHLGIELKQRGRNVPLKYCSTNVSGVRLAVG